jgi:hypothetical protein
MLDSARRERTRRGRNRKETKNGIGYGKKRDAR